MKNLSNSKIALGTVQFGLDYGISNKSGQVDPKTASNLLNYAFTSGINTLDTAAAYNCSEEIIGSITSIKNYNFNIISKFPENTNEQNITNYLNDTLKKLQTKKIKAYLAHDSNCLKNEKLREQLNIFKKKGLIEQIGVSVYYPKEINYLLKENINFDIVQLPFSVFDQRFKPLFKELKKRNIEIHARSVFLQGLFFISPDKLPKHFHSIKNKITAIQNICTSENIPLSALLLNYAITQKHIDKIIIGVTNTDELKQNINAHNYIKKCNELNNKLDSFAISDEQIILPFNWR